MFTGKPFAHFDPLHDTFAWERLNAIVARARALLPSRSRTEIEYAALVADWMLTDEAIADLPAAGAADGTPVQMLRARMVHFDIADLPDLPDATWPEIFAAFALACLDEATRLAQLASAPGDAGDEFEGAPIEAGVAGPDDLALTATEAVCMAEALSGNLPEIEALAAKKAEGKISVHARNAGLQRHAGQGTVTARFVEAFRAGQLPGKSCADAARRFFDSLPADERKLYSAGNAVRTLCEAVSRERKQSGAAPGYATK